jgi:hypothetical protein
MAERALTLRQPWAWLVANGHKGIENRPRGFSHKSFRGDFWIHAANESSASIGSWPLAVKLCHKLLGADFQIPPARELAFGAIVGRARITGILVPQGQMFHKPDVPWHFQDQYGFIVENAAPLSIPVPCRGHQGFWTVPADVLGKLRDELATLDCLNEELRRSRPGKEGKP